MKSFVKGRMRCFVSTAKIELPETLVKVIEEAVESSPIFESVSDFVEHACRELLIKSE